MDTKFDFINGENMLIQVLIFTLNSDPKILISTLSSDLKIWNILAMPPFWKRGYEINNHASVSVPKYIFMRVDTAFTRWPYGFEDKDINRTQLTFL